MQEDRKKIHIFNSFMNPYGGSEQETLFLYENLKEVADVSMWAASSRASKILLEEHQIRKISVLSRNVPQGGTYVFAGAHWRNKAWPLFINPPERLIYIFNTFHAKIAALVGKLPFWLRWPDAEIVLISEFQKNILGLAGVVHPSPIDVSRFLPAEAVDRPFTVGRMSRDTADKHHAEDKDLYCALLDMGCHLEIQGGTVLQEQLGRRPNCNLLAEGTFAAEVFLNRLDVFCYRSGTHVETFGRVVLEAMACALPVVCHVHGGYAEHIEHGENGFLFRTTAEAVDIIGTLKADPAMRHRIGAQARATVERLFSRDALRRRTRFYVDRLEEPEASSAPGHAI